MGENSCFHQECQQLKYGAARPVNAHKTHKAT